MNSTAMATMVILDLIAGYGDNHLGELGFQGLDIF